MIEEIWSTKCKWHFQLHLSNYDEEICQFLHRYVFVLSPSAKLFPLSSTTVIVIQMLPYFHHFNKVIAGNRHNITEFIKFFLFQSNLYNLSKKKKKFIYQILVIQINLYVKFQISLSFILLSRSIYLNDILWKVL